MKALILFLVTATIWADEAPTKEKMREELNTFVQEKSEAAASIAPLIDRVREILSSDSKKEPETKPKPTQMKPTTQVQ